MAIYKVEDEDEYEKYSKHRKIVLYITAKWGEACKEVAPKFAHLIEDYDEIWVLEIDSDSKNMKFLTNDAEDLPCFRFIKDGEKIKETTGDDIDEIKEALEQLNSNE